MDFNYSTLFEKNTFLIMILSGKICVFTLVLHIFIGVPLAAFMSRKKSILVDILDFVVVIPIIFPPMVIGFFLLLILGKNGILGGIIFKTINASIIFSFFGVLIASFVAGFPFMVKSVQSGIESINYSLIEVSYSLGKSRIETFFRIILPNIKDNIITGAVLAGGRSLGEVGITLMLGGNISGRTETVSLAIYNAVFDGEYKKAFLLSIFLSLISFSLFMCIKHFSNKEVRVI